MKLWRIYKIQLTGESTKVGGYFKESEATYWLERFKADDLRLAKSLNTIPHEFIMRQEEK